MDDLRATYHKVHVLGIAKTPAADPADRTGPSPRRSGRVLMPRIAGIRPSELRRLLLRMGFELTRHNDH